MQREKGHNCNAKIITQELLLWMSRFIFSTVKVIAASTYTARRWKVASQLMTYFFTHGATKGSYFLWKRIHKILIDFASINDFDLTSKRTVADRKLIKMTAITGKNQTLWQHWQSGVSLRFSLPLHRLILGSRNISKSVALEQHMIMTLLHKRE